MAYSPKSSSVRDLYCCRLAVSMDIKLCSHDCGIANR